MKNPTSSIHLLSIAIFTFTGKSCGSDPDPANVENHYLSSQVENLDERTSRPSYHFFRWC